MYENRCFLNGASETAKRMYNNKIESIQILLQKDNTFPKNLENSKNFDPNRLALVLKTIKKMQKKRSIYCIIKC